MSFWSDIVDFASGKQSTPAITSGSASTTKPTTGTVVVQTSTGSKLVDSDDEWAPYPGQPTVTTGAGVGATVGAAQAAPSSSSNTMLYVGLAALGVGAVVLMGSKDGKKLLAGLHGHKHKRSRR